MFKQAFSDENLLKNNIALIKQTKQVKTASGTNLSTSIVKKLTSPRAHFNKFNVKDCAIFVADCILRVSCYAVLLSERVYNK